jgi:hypothetical protein
MQEKVTVYIERDLEYLVPDYLDNRKKDVVLIHEALMKEDFESIRIMGHNMKGTGGGYGFEAISVFGAELQEAAINRNTGAISRLAGELMDYIGRVEIVYV